MLAQKQPKDMERNRGGVSLYLHVAINIRISQCSIHPRLKAVVSD